jgi:DNA-binding transcriptional MerR regulator
MDVSMQSTPEESPHDLGFSGTRAAKVVGITYRQLDYWARTDLIRPSLSDASGSGSRRRYSYNDLLELKAIKKLLDAGIKLEQVRRVFEYLREHVVTDIAAAHIVIDGNSVNLYDDGQLIDVLQRGQGVLNVLSMGGVKSELEAELSSPDGVESVTDGTDGTDSLVRQTG